MVKMEQNRRNKRLKMDAKKVYGNAITGIAMAAILVASVMAALIGSTGAYSNGGPYNIIQKNTGVTVQSVLIGQDVSFPVSEGWSLGEVTIYRVKDDTVQWTKSVPDSNILTITGDAWTKEGVFYVNYDVNSKTREAQLSFDDPDMPLKLKVGTKEVSSIAVDTNVKVDISGTNLFPEDKVDLKIVSPDGQIKYDEINDQPFTNISVTNLAEWYGGSPGNLVTKGWTIGDYTFQVKTKSNYACGLDASSAVKDLHVIKEAIEIEADKTSAIELEQVTLTVTGVAGDEIEVYGESSDVIFKRGVLDTPWENSSYIHKYYDFTDTIDEDGMRKYAVEFNDSGSYTITVTVTGPWNPRVGAYDTVDITVLEKVVIFDVPSTVVIGENLTIRGTANTGDTVDIAVEDYVYPLLNDLIIDETGEFSKEIDTATAGIAPFTEPGPVILTAYIERAAGAGPVSERDDGSAKIFMLNDAGGGIDISASEINIGKNETIILTIGAVPDHNVSVTTSDTAHTVFEYNRYDFTGTSNNIINIAPAGTISIPADIGDCGSQADAMNIHGVWKTVDADGIMKFEVHFTDIGTYKIAATDYGTDYPTASRLDEESVNITVSVKNVTFDVPSVVVIGDRVEIKGTADSGTYVDIFVDDVLYPQLNDIVIEEGEFSKEVTTTEVGRYAAGIAELKAYIDCASAPGSPPPAIDDGSTNVFMVEPWLTAGLSTDSVDQEAEFTVSGSAPGSREVEILCVPPMGGGGKSLLDEGVKGVALRKASVSTVDNTFTKKLTVQEDADSGIYYVIVLSSGMDGEWDMTGTDDLEEALDRRYRIPSLTSGIILTMSQEDVVEIFDDLTQCVVGSDDLMRILTLKVGGIETLTLNPVDDVVLGEPLKVTGETSRKDGSIIWITVKKPYYELIPQAAIVKDNMFNATFDTTGTQPGTYTVKAIDGYGYTAATSVNMLAEMLAPTSFYTDGGIYPSIMGTQNDTITLERMYTYPCTGTGGHSEYAAFYDKNGTKMGEGHWNGYQTGDYHYITFDAPFTLEIGETYNYTIRTGSYPQIIHNQKLTTENGTITCTRFTDANGRRYNNYIPAIRLE